jgi:hypothetical protein
MSRVIPEAAEGGCPESIALSRDGFRVRELALAPRNDE